MGKIKDLLGLHDIREDYLTRKQVEALRDTCNAVLRRSHLPKLFVIAQFGGLYDGAMRKAAGWLPRKVK